MSILATQSWQGQTFSMEIAGFRASLRYDVSGTTSDPAAIAAVPYVINTPHPDNLFLRCFRVYIIDRPGPNYCQVGVDFAFPPDGNAFPDSDRLKDPPSYEWQRSSESVPVDTDRFGNAFTNSAGDTIDPPPTRNARNLVLTIKRWELYFDKDKADLYEDTTNLTDIRVPGTSGVFKKGSMKCTTIIPTSEYRANQKFVLMTYQFETRQAITPDLTWKLRFIDEGLSSWASYQKAGAVRVPILGRNGRTITSPVLLNGNGNPAGASVPIDTTNYFPDPATGVFQANPSKLASTIKKQKGDGTDYPGGGKPCFLVYEQFAPTNWTPLGLFR